jgi:hypothetical protein
VREGTEPRSQRKNESTKGDWFFVVCGSFFFFLFLLALFGALAYPFIG